MRISLVGNIYTIDTNWEITRHDTSTYKLFRNIINCADSNYDTVDGRNPAPVGNYWEL